MDILTQSHLTTLRGLLNYRLQELRAEVHAAELARETAAAGEHEVADRKDEAALRQFTELGGAEEQRDVEEITAVESALQRLDAGVYGDCLACGEPIPLQRLLVQPAAQRCAPCQATFEHRAARPS
ncbi:hypothetical protein BURC_02256 [Burkholderiaceae bacterium]|nr:hypothetical protein BURC_02256 [Burkholderiaceae bacterium]